MGLHGAVEARDLAEVQNLLVHGEVDQLDTEGWTPLMWADNEPMVRVLLAAGARADFATEKGESVLMAVARRGDAAAVRALVEVGGLDPNAADEVGDTALMEAACVGNLESVRELVALGADPNRATTSGGTALEAAEREGHVAFADFLRERGADAGTGA